MPANLRSKINKILGNLLIVFLLLAGFTLFATNTLADEAEDLKKIEEEIKKQEKELKETESELNKVRDKSKQISDTLSKLSGNLNLNQSQIDDLQKNIDELTVDINNLDKKMGIKKGDLEQNTKIRDIALKELYINNKKNLAEVVLAESGVSQMFETAAYYFNFVNNSESLISLINGDIKGYEEDKNEVAEIKAKIETQKDQLKKVVDQLAAQVNKSKTDLASTEKDANSLEGEKQNIQRKLSELSAKQQAILGEKTDSGTFTTSVGDIPMTGEASSRADFNPGFKKAFAGFSFGAPHRKGLSQYGAKGRAEDGQDYKEILKAYYGDIEIVEMSGLPKNISTDKGSLELDGKYLNGLAEMPASWHKEALKAQAVAARTYALSYVGWRVSDKEAKKSICTTESCQVWSSSKATASSAASWHKAVSDTKSEVMVSKKSGYIFSAFYAASSGGYNYSYSSIGHSTKGGWDTECGSKNCWTSEAYESKGGSPWFYKGWYKSRSNKACGRSHPWLTESEFADIVGAAVLYTKDEGNEAHLSQIDAQSCWGESISGTWSRDTVKEKTGITSVDSVSVSYSNGGTTAEVKIKTNKGEYKFSGEDFRDIFNLRAPGVLNIKSALYNIEVKD